MLLWATNMAVAKRRLEPILKGLPDHKRDAFDMAGKWPLALKAFSCGASLDRCFVDASQSSGAAGADDGALLLTTSEGPRVVHFEVKGASRKKGLSSTFTFKGIRTEGTEWELLFLVARTADPITVDDWFDCEFIDQHFWLGIVHREHYRLAVQPWGQGPQDATVTIPTGRMGRSWLSPYVRWVRFIDPHTSTANKWWGELLFGEGPNAAASVSG